MPVHKKWTYWHRVIWADNDCEQGAQLKVGSLLGLTHRDTSCCRLHRDEQKKSFVLVDYVKLQYVGKLLTTATPEEVVAALGPAILDAAALKVLRERPFNIVETRQ
jgi:hypothetical protein